LYNKRIGLVDLIGFQEYALTEENTETFIRSPFDWRVVVIESTQENNRGFYLCKTLFLISTII